MPYRLTIRKIDQSCLFDLTWGKGQQLSTHLAFPSALLGLYDAWRRAYLGYYKQALRGRVGATGQVVAAEVDWHSQLKQAEARLLSEFHTWLKDGKLFDLRAELTSASQAAEPDQAKTELFITCDPIAIARLPWETWELGQQVQIVRSPPNIRAATGDRQSFRRGKARVLAILGDETGLNFTGERTALNAQKRLLEIHYVGWQPGEDTNALKQRICRTIADPRGWDVLFFAGHSNEAALLDGQVAIAPNTALSIKELTPALREAQRQGLQFALFNSCSGLDIAQALVSLGLSQVAIMREPIHNEVAQTFLVQLLQHLAQFDDVQEALGKACEFLKVKQELTYPSAYLVPSLFRHPDSVPYRIQPVGWRALARRWRPTKHEAIAVAALGLLSLVPLVQDWLLDQRVWAQAVYRDRTGQIATDPPPILLVQIDPETFNRQGIANPRPIDRSLLADLVTRLNERQAAVIGLDYLLDMPQTDHDPTLNQALRQAIEQNQTWPVLISSRNRDFSWTNPYPTVVNPDWILQGNAFVPFRHVLPRESWPEAKTPFSYQLATAWTMHQKAGAGDADVPRPSLSGPPLETQVQAYQRDHHLGLSPWAEVHPLTQISTRFGQHWLQPLIDFSMPPSQVYRTVPAWQLLDDPDAALLPLASLDQTLVMIVPGYYDAAGIGREGDDNFPQPPAIGYWRDRTGQRLLDFTGGETHAYITHHLIHNRLVIPIPDLWVILAAAALGKALTLYGDQHSPRRLTLTAWLATATMSYGVLALQIYITAAVLLPWLLPSLTLWLYSLPKLKETSHEYS
ncbi:CHASE2 domain-containing protein [Nodosilinea sp. E11]|uniref:CHASE2 domain-containing protein n=1 Tax=Nodosilinea sp. E11 TaxID=3037479 RepID=UPI0029344233|nr:CHASE2 domain-containing protein [Nodosilinea sp. E11]WOD39782.1 CHASE2 domain-containing protein [Nodosilinea sp. E11]